MLWHCLRGLRIIDNKKFSNLKSFPVNKSEAEAWHITKVRYGYDLGKRILFLFYII